MTDSFGDHIGDSIGDDMCYICYDTDTIFDGKSNSGVVTDCRHFFCIYCIEDMHCNQISQCPICREDWTDWICSHYPLSRDDDDDDDEEVEEDEEVDGWI